MQSIKKNKTFLHLPIKVFPVPGGPNSSKPFGGPLKPVKMSLES